VYDQLKLILDSFISKVTCPNALVFARASVIWGAIGPKRIFSPGAIYSHLLYFFIPGIILPIILYLVARRYPRSSIRFLNAPIIFGGIGEYKLNSMRVI
jgi:OPT oligopeptide transporter protein